MTHRRICAHSFKSSYKFLALNPFFSAIQQRNLCIFRIDVPFNTIIFSFQAHYYLPSGANFKVYSLLKNLYGFSQILKGLYISHHHTRFLFKIMFFSQSTLVVILSSLVKYKSEVIKSFRATSAIPKLIFYLYFVGEIVFQV